MAGYSRFLPHGKAIDIPALSPVGLQISPGAVLQFDMPGMAEAVSPQQVLEGDSSESMPAPFRKSARQTTPTARSIARFVFSEPHLTWTVSDAAQRLGWRKQDVSRRLFAEGKSFREIVFSQRLSRFLCDRAVVPTIDNRIARMYGFPERCSFEDAIFSQFGATALLLRFAYEDFEE